MWSVLRKVFCGQLGPENWIQKWSVTCIPVLLIMETHVSNFFRYKNVSTRAHLKLERVCNATDSMWSIDRRIAVADAPAVAADWSTGVVAVVALWKGSIWELWGSAIDRSLIDRSTWFRYWSNLLLLLIKIVPLLMLMLLLLLLIDPLFLLLLLLLCRCCCCCYRFGTMKDRIDQCSWSILLIDAPVDRFFAVSENQKE